MKLYIVEDDYITYLKQFDNNVSNNKHNSRPYVGIIISIDEINYYAPLASPKVKHLKMKNQIDLFKIKNGDLGVINLNNMIPILKENVKEINFKNCDFKYSKLLKKQLDYIILNSNKLINNAIKLRNIIIKNNNECTNYELHLKERCTNISLLEKVYKDFKK